MGGLFSGLLNSRVLSQIWKSFRFVVLFKRMALRPGTLQHRVGADLTRGVAVLMGLRGGLWVRVTGGLTIRFLSFVFSIKKWYLEQMMQKNVDTSTPPLQRQVLTLIFERRPHSEIPPLPGVGDEEGDEEYQN